jgi:hypothetical protein
LKPGGIGRPAVSALVFSAVTRLGLVLGVLVGGDDQVLEDLDVVFLEERRVDLQSP